MKAVLIFLSLFLIFPLNLFAGELILYDFEEETTGNWVALVTAKGIDWVPDPTGRSAGVLAIHLDSDIIQPDYMAKAYIFMQNQHFFMAESIKIDVYLTQGYPEGFTWFVLYAKQDEAWMQHSSEGFGQENGPDYVIEQWTTITMDISGASDEWNTDWDPLLPNEEVGMLIDMMGGEFHGDIYIDNVRLIGVEDPAFVDPPDPPTGISVDNSSPGINIVSWVDETRIETESYKVYVSSSPITDVSAEGVQLIGTGIVQGTGSFSHHLFTVDEPGSVEYYYAVTSIDAYGREEIITNPGQNTTVSAISNTTRKIPPIIYFKSGAITIDGDLNEYSDLMPFQFDTTVSVVDDTIDGD
ncbi:MAG: hypothetical protein ACE5QV_04115, partial [Fidelibacterota bacterium]